MIRTTTKAHAIRLAPALLLAAAGLASSASAQDRLWNGTTGNWSVPTNWMPNDVPDNGVENAVINAGGAYTASVNGGYSIGALTLTNPTGLLHILNSNRLNIAAGISNDSTITINPTSGGSGTLLQCLASQSLTGSGVLVLNASANLDTAYITYNGGGEVLTQAAGHTIRGTGNIYVNVANQGTINADVSGRTLQFLGANKSNANLITATNGGTLLVNSVAVSQSGAGRFVADAGTTQFNSASISGGAVTAQNGGAGVVTGTSTFDGVTFSGPTTINNAANMRWSNSAPTVNNGTITVNTTAGGSQSAIQCLGNTVLNGTGEVVLNASPNVDTAIITYNGGGEVLTNAATHTIRGTGRIWVNIANNGLISADRTGRSLLLSNVAKTNNGLMQAIDGGFLDIIIPITQGPLGEIYANNSRVRMASTVIANGFVTAGDVDGLIELTGTTDFNNVTLTGPLQINNAVAMRTIAGFTNNGSITVNATAGGSQSALQALATCTVGGTGEIILNANAGNLDTAIVTYNGGGEVLTLPNSQTIRGTGRVYVSLANNGLVEADRAGRILMLSNVAKTNNNIMRAVNGAFLDITIPITQSPTAMIVADDARVRMASTVITNGMVTAQNASGLIEVTGTTDFNNVTLTGPLQVNNAQAMRTSTGFTNNGTITINPAAGGSATYLQSLASNTIGGTGQIILNANTNLDTAYLTYNGGGEVLTIPNMQTIRGTGRVYVSVLNNGLIEADRDGRILHLSNVAKTNNNIMRAVNNAFLDITIPITQGSSGQIVADGGRVRMAGTTISNGAVHAKNAGLIELTANTTDFNSVTLTGPLQVDNAAVMRTTTGFTNNGLITINPSAGGSGTYLQSLASNTISGSGTIRLNANPGNFDTAYLTYNGGGEILTLGPDQTLEGRGRLYVRTTAHGRVAPGFGFASAGQLDTRQNLTLASDSTLDIEIGGATPSQYDRITGVGSLVLQNGTIRITTVNGFTPAVGQTFDIVSGPAVSGQFCGHIFARGFTVAYSANGIRVTYGGCVADVDGGSGCGIPDGGVTIDDLLFYINLFELGDINADVDDGSFTGTVDGGVTIDDLLYYLIRFEDGC